MATYSQDLRQRVIDCVERNEGSLRQIARRFVVSLSFVVRLLQLHRRTGSLDPKPPAGGRPAALGPEDLERLQELVRQQPDATLKEQANGSRLVQPHGHLGVPLEKLRLTRKKKQSCSKRRRAGPPGDPGRKRRDFYGARLAGVDPHRLVFVDASGANTAITRTYGRAPRGTAGLRQVAPGPLGDDRADLQACGSRE